MNAPKPKKARREFSTERCPLSWMRFLDETDNSKSTGRRMIRDGEIRVTRVRRRLYVMPADLEEWIRRASSGEFALDPVGACRTGGRKEGNQ